jgi:hypothetical protein
MLWPAPYHTPHCCHSHLPPPAPQIEESALDWLAGAGYDPVYGARPVKRAIQRDLETPLARALLMGAFQEDDTVVVSGRGCCCCAVCCLACMCWWQEAASAACSSSRVESACGAVMPAGFMAVQALSMMDADSQSYLLPFLPGRLRQPRAPPPSPSAASQASRRASRSQRRATTRTRSQARSQRKQRRSQQQRPAAAKQAAATGLSRCLWLSSTAAGPDSAAAAAGRRSRKHRRQQRQQHLQTRQLSTALQARALTP